MDPRRAQVERNAHFTRGPRFFNGEGQVMFEFVIDAGNVIGPRPATQADRAKHPEAWRMFEVDLPPIAEEDFTIPAQSARSSGQSTGELPSRRKSRSQAA